MQKLRVHQGLNPYLEILDEILPDYHVSGQEELGVIEIPADKIVGTKTRGRSDAFASNFMPLIPEKSEFCMKWQTLCQYHLGESGLPYHEAREVINHGRYPIGHPTTKRP